MARIVFSTTLREVGSNARLMNGNAENVASALKLEKDGYISVAGGKPYFQSGLSLTLKPLGTESLPQGVTLLRYAPAA